MEKISARATKAAQWREVVAEQVASGKTVSAFCAEREIKPNTFHYWRDKYCKVTTQSRFIAMTQSQRRPGRAASRSDAVQTRDLRGFDHAAPQIILPNGVRIDLGEGIASGAVSQLIHALCGVGRPAKDGHHAKS